MDEKKIRSSQHGFTKGNLEAFQKLVLETRLYIQLRVWVFPDLLLDEAAKPLGGSHTLKQLWGVCWYWKKTPLFNLYPFTLSGKCHQGSKLKASCLRVLSWSCIPGFCYRQCSMWFQGDALVPGLYRQRCPQVVMAAGSTLPGHAVFLISDCLWPRDMDCSLENLFGVMAPLPWQLQWVMWETASLSLRRPGAV